MDIFYTHTLEIVKTIANLDFLENSTECTFAFCLFSLAIWMIEHIVRSHFHYSSFNIYFI